MNESPHANSSEGVVVDFANFLGVSVPEALRRLATCDFDEVDDLWTEASAQTDDEVMQFFGSCEALVVAHVKWHAESRAPDYALALSHLVEHYPAADGFLRVLDFGGGIATDTIFLAERGYSVSLADLPGPMLDFARYRISRRGLEVTVVESHSALPSVAGEFDVILCFDVFEHLPDPLEAARRLSNVLRPGGILIQYGNFDDVSEVHPSVLASGVERFLGPRWNWHIAGLGFRRVSGYVFRKEGGWRKQLQRSRFALYERTGRWVTVRR